MRLVDAASFFNRMPCKDGYTGRLLFYGQLNVYDEAKRDAEATERRILSVHPSVSPPVRRVVEAADSRWIMGKANVDWFGRRKIRTGYVAHECSALATYFTLGELCRGEPGIDAYCAEAWVKNMAEVEQSSDLTGRHNLHFASNEPIQATDVVRIGTIHYLCRKTHVGPAGTLIALADVLEEPFIETVTVADGAYDPVSESLAASTESVQVLRVRWQSLFEYANPAAPKLGADDAQFVAAQADITLTPGMRITAADGEWLLRDATEWGDVWVARGTKHA